MARKLEEFLETSEKELMCSFSKSKDSYLYFFEMNACLASIIDTFLGYYDERLKQADDEKKTLEGSLQEMIDEAKKNIEKDTKDREAEKKKAVDCMTEYQNKLKKWKEKRVADKLDPEEEGAEDRPKQPEIPVIPEPEQYQPNDEDNNTPAFEMIGMLRVKKYIEQLKTSNDYKNLIEQDNLITNLKEQKEKTFLTFRPAKDNLLSKCSDFFKDHIVNAEAITLKKPFNVIYIDQINSLSNDLKKANNKLEELKGLPHQKEDLERSISLMKNELHLLNVALANEKKETGRLKEENQRNIALASSSQAQELRTLREENKSLNEQYQMLTEKLREAERSLEEETNFQIKGLIELRTELDERKKALDLNVLNFETRVKEFEEERSKQLNKISNKQKCQEEFQLQLEARKIDLDQLERKLASATPTKQRPSFTGPFDQSVLHQQDATFNRGEDSERMLEEEPRSRTHIQTKDSIRERSGSRPRGGRTDSDLTEDQRRQKNELVKLRKDLDEKSNQVKQEAEAFRRREEDLLNLRKRFEDEKRVFNENFKKNAIDSQAPTASNPLFVMGAVLLVLLSGFFIGTRFPAHSK